MVKFRKIALLTTIVLLTLGVQNIYAQSYYEDDNRTFYGGLVAGAAFSQIDGDSYAGYYRFGFTGGGIVYAEFAPKYAVSVEVLYSQRGSKSNKRQLTTSENAEIHSYNVKLNYAEIPVLLNYFDKRESHFGIGLSYAQLVSQEETASTNPSIVADTANFARYSFKSNDINGIASVNLHLYKGFFLNIRYQYSLFSIRDSFHPEFSRSDAAKQTNNLIVLRIMYLFN